MRVWRNCAASVLIRCPLAKIREALHRPLAVSMFGAAILRDDQNWRNDSNTRTGNRREDGEQHAAARLLAAEGVVRSGRLFLLEMTDQGGSLGHD